MNSSLWTIVDPIGDGTVAITGGSDRVLGLSLPPGPSHDLWTGGNNALRIVQSISNRDFEVEVKFESMPAAISQSQGIIVEQSPGNYIRFGVHWDGAVFRSYSATYANNAPTVRENSPLCVGSGPLWLRVKRDGNVWSHSWSSEGTSFMPGASFSYALTSSRIGPFAGNAAMDGPAPAWTSVVDYFFNIRSPIVPEDGAASGMSAGAAAPPSEASPPASWFDDRARQPSNVPGPALPGGSRTQSGPSLRRGDPAHPGVASDMSGEDSPPVDSRFPPGSSLPALVTTPRPGAGGDAGFRGDLAGAPSSDSRLTSGGFNWGDAIAPFVDHGPLIDVWYGGAQSFGARGRPQTFVNVLGNVTDPSGVTSLTYTVNGGPPQALTIGPNGTRLVGPGDFNAEIEYGSLGTGANSVVLRAVNGRGNVSTRMVTVNVSDGGAATRSATIDWGTAESIQTVAQIVDGLWTIESGGSLRTAQVGYDRMVAIGDTTWESYDVLAEVTVHSVDCSSDYGVGLIVGWKGHTGAEQPRLHHPFPALGWYAKFQTPGSFVNIYTNTAAHPEQVLVRDTSGRTLALGVKYMFRFRVERLGASSSRYSLKVWAAGTIEPEAFDLTADGEASAGSLVLGAHRADVSFGRIVVTAL